MMKAKAKIPTPTPPEYPLKKQFLAIEHFEIYDSLANTLELTEKDISSFRHREKEEEMPEYTPAQFVRAIKDELEYLGLSIEELAKSTYITPDRMKSLLRGKATFRKEETTEIKKKLYID